MSTHDNFDMTRLMKLAINDIRMQSKAIFIFSLALLIFILILPFDLTNNTNVYLIILYISGFLISGSAFKDLHDPYKAHHSLMLPCSNLERFLNRWLLTSVGYAIALLGLYYIFILVHFLILLSLMNAGMFHEHVKLMNIIDPNLWISIGRYIIFQSAILLGAITFKKHSLIKTALVLVSFFLVLIFSSMIILLIFFVQSLMEGHPNMLVMAHWITINGGYIIYWLFAAPVFWYCTYLKVTEFELK